MSLYKFEDPITSIKGVGEFSAQKLEKLEIRSVGDLVRYLPTRYIDFSRQVQINDLKEKISASFIAEISSPKSFYTKSGKLITQATATDISGKITLAWFNNPYIKKILVPNQEYTIAGTPSFFGNKLTIISPVIEEGNSFSINTKGLVPVFPLTKGITSRWLRQKLFTVLEDIKINEPLPKKIVDKLHVENINDAYLHIHFPKDKLEKQVADKRLSLNQHLLINLTNLLKSRNLGESPQVTIDQKIHLSSLSKLPFQLTTGQTKTTSQIYKDLSTKNHTHRLIQGDTGSGKTATIILAANQALSQNFSCAIIAPTQILANQHFETFSQYLLYPNQITLVVGGSKELTDNKKPTLYIGTHALISHLPKELKYPLLFLAIDEQHKFGVHQREELLNRNPIPHLINLSATPIPRTMALGLLGDIKISNIKYKPQNRLPIKTHVTSKSYFSKSTVWLTNQLKSGNKIYVVCPSIHDHETETASVTKMFDHYKKILPPQTPIFSLHGQLKKQQQDEIINNFKSQEGSVLISTSLIEVGIDIPSANIMIIHSAERFGLAQLHQLRGRVGRGASQSYCFLVPSTDEETETERLELLQKYTSGITLAKKDLLLRGAGEVFGLKQHGALQTKLKYFWSKKSFLLAKRIARELISDNPDEAEAIASSLSSC